MKLSKRILAAVTAASCAFCINFAGANTLIGNATDYSDQLKYGDYLSYVKVDKDEDGTYDYVEISSCNIFATEIEIPSEIDGLSVTSIGSDAFRDCSSLTSITIENRECEIFDDSDTICNGEDENYEYYFNGTIYGYENSTAQAYAEKYDYKFALIGDAPEPTEPETTEPVVTTKPVETTAPIGTTEPVETIIPIETTTVPATDEPIVTTTQPIIPSDPIGDHLSVRDCAFIASMLAKNQADQLPEAADFNKDGKINIRDAAAIASYLASKNK